jgi:hypothetical protein
VPASVRPTRAATPSGGLSGQPSSDGPAASRLQLQVRFVPGLPFQNHDARVVLELVGLMGEDVAHQLPDGLGGWFAGGHGGADEVGQQLLAEELSGRGAASVTPSVYSSSRSPGSGRVSHQAGLVSCRPSGRLGGQRGGWTREVPRRMSGSGVRLDPPEPAGVDVEAGDHGGGELASGELPLDGGVDLGGDLGKVEGVAAGVPVGTDSRH